MRNPSLYILCVCVCVGVRCWSSYSSIVQYISIAIYGQLYKYIAHKYEYNCYTTTYSGNGLGDLPIDAVHLCLVQFEHKVHTVVSVGGQSEPVVQVVDVVGLAIVLKQLVTGTHTPPGLGDGILLLSDGVDCGRMHSSCGRTLVAIDKIQQWDEVPLALVPDGATVQDTICP